MLGLGGLVAVIYGAAIAGSEWSWGTLKNAVARGESRTRYMLGTFAAIAVMVARGPGDHVRPRVSGSRWSGRRSPACRRPA